MKVNEKQNLIPEEVKEKYAKRYFTAFVILLCVIHVFSIVLPYISIAIISNQINKIENENNEYNLQKVENENLQKQLDEYNGFIKTFEEATFPFTTFMYDLEIMRPVSVHIISADTQDRLINEGADEKEKSNKEKEQEQEKEKEKDKSEKKDSEEKEIVSSENPSIKYEKDLSGQKIVIRGYGESQSDISEYLHSISSLPYISNLDVVAIEEHVIEGGVYNIFEITVVGVGYNENQIQG